MYCCCYSAIYHDGSVTTVSVYLSELFVLVLLDVLVYFMNLQCVLGEDPTVHIGSYVHCHVRGVSGMNAYFVHNSVNSLRYFVLVLKHLFIHCRVQNEGPSPCQWTGCA